MKWLRPQAAQMKFSHIKIKSTLIYSNTHRLNANSVLESPTTEASRRIFVQPSGCCSLAKLVYNISQNKSNLVNWPLYMYS